MTKTNMIKMMQERCSVLWQELAEIQVATMRNFEEHSGWQGENALAKDYSVCVKRAEWYAVAKLLEDMGIEWSTYDESFELNQMVYKYFHK